MFGDSNSWVLNTFFCPLGEFSHLSISLSPVYVYPPDPSSFFLCHFRTQMLTPFPSPELPGGRGLWTAAAQDHLAKSLPTSRVAFKNTSPRESRALWLEMLTIKLPQIFRVHQVPRVSKLFFQCLQCRGHLLPTQSHYAWFFPGESLKINTPWGLVSQGNCTSWISATGWSSVWRLAVPSRA